MEVDRRTIRDLEILRLVYLCLDRLMEIVGMQEEIAAEETEVEVTK